MIKPSIRSAAILIIALSTLSASFEADAQSRDTKKPTGSIAGVVTIDGKPAPDVGVMLFRIVIGDAEAPAIGRTRSDTTGTFVFEGLFPGEYGLDAYAPGRIVFDQTDEEGAVAVALADGAAVKDVAIPLEIGCAITGRLIDEDGNPITAEWVDVSTKLPSGNDGGKPVWRSAASSDDRGIYRVFGLPPGAYVVAAGRVTSLEATDYDLTVHYDRRFHGGSPTREGAKVVEVARGGEAQGIDIVLKRSGNGFTMHGKVVHAETNLPLEQEVLLHFGPWLDGSPDALRRIENVGRNGEFRINYLVPGSYGIQASLTEPDGGSFVSDPIEVPIVDRDVTDVVIRMVPAATVTGVIAPVETDASLDLLEAQGYPPFFLFSVDPTQPWWSAEDSVSAGLVVRPDRTFTATGIRPGSYRAIVNTSVAKGLYVVRIEKDGAPIAGLLRIEKSETVNHVRIVVGRALGVLRGRVLVKNRAVDLGRVGVVGFEQGSGLPRLGRRVDPSGAFELEGFPPGETEVRAVYFLESGKLVISKPVVVVVPATGAVDVTLEPDFGEIPVGQGGGK